MELIISDIMEIIDEIVSEKIIKKNKAYGNSIYDIERILGTNTDLEELIKVRVDDKLKRMKLLDPKNLKYDSEIKEIIAYLLHLLNYRKHNKVILNDFYGELVKEFESEDLDKQAELNKTIIKDTCNCGCEDDYIDDRTRKTALKEIYNKFKIPSPTDTGKDYQ